MLLKDQFCDQVTCCCDLHAIVHLICAILQIEAVLESDVIKSLLEIAGKKKHPLYPAARKTLGRISETVKGFSGDEMKLFLLRSLLKGNIQFDSVSNPTIN